MLMKSMKKTLLLIPIILLSSCGENNSIKIICPKGAPSIAFYNYSKDSNFETNDQPTNIVSFLRNNSPYDAVIIDTITGIKSIQKDNSFKIAATITFGNYFIVKTKDTVPDTFIEGSKITLFGKNQTPDLLFKYLYGENYDISYVDSSTDAKALLQSPDEHSDYIFLAQPAIYAAMQVNKQAKIVENVQEKYKVKTGNKIIQASIFVKSSLSNALIDEFLNKIEKQINDGLQNPNLIKEGMDKLPQEEQKVKYQVTSPIAFKLLENNNQLGLGYQKAIDIKNDIGKFIELFGMERTDEKIFYK